MNLSSKIRENAPIGALVSFVGFIGFLLLSVKDEADRAIGQPELFNPYRHLRVNPDDLQRVREDGEVLKYKYAGDDRYIYTLGSFDYDPVRTAVQYPEALPEPTVDEIPEDEA
jgi:hypothetical protein